MAYFSMLIGAIVGMFLFTRLSRWILSKFKMQDPLLSVASVVLWLPIAFVVAAFGMADGGPVNWGGSFVRTITLDIPAGLLVLAIDLIAWRGRKAKASG